jgi:hypothetical protein
MPILKDRYTVAATVTRFPELAVGLTRDRARQLAEDMEEAERSAWLPRLWLVLEHRPEARVAAVLLLLALGGCSREVLEQSLAEQAMVAIGNAVARQLN